MLAKILKPEPRNASLTFCILIGLRRSGLSVPYSRIAVRVGDHRKLRRHRLAAGELLEHAAQHRLDRVEHVVLRDEAHFHVELIEFTGRTIGAGVLVAEAGRDLEIAVEARDHGELLELLRRLRQRVELAGMQPRRHQEVARAFGRGRGQDRGLEFEEAALLHAAADRVDDGAAFHDIGVQAVAPQIEEAVLQPDFFRVFLIAEHRHRQLGGRSQHLDLGDVDLNCAGRHLGILGAAGTAAHLAVDLHHPFGAQLFHLLERRAVRIGDHLGEPVMVAQVDEEDAAVIAHPVHPAGEPHLFADVGLAERAAGVGAITVHAGVRQKRPAAPTRAGPWNRRTTAQRPVPCQGSARQSRLIVVNILEQQHAAELALVVAGKAASRCERIGVPIGAEQPVPDG